MRRRYFSRVPDTLQAVARLLATEPQRCDPETGVSVGCLENAPPRDLGG